MLTNVKMKKCVGKIFAQNGKGVFLTALPTHSAKMTIAFVGKNVYICPLVALWKSA